MASETYGLATPQELDLVVVGAEATKQMMYL